MSAMYGANPEQLSALGRNLIGQKEAISSVIAAVSSALAGTAWEGPARQRFQQDWDTTFRTALNNLNAAFDSAGNDCVRRAQDLQTVMGAR